MTRSAGAYRGWEHRRERDERVEGNLPADLVPLWRKVKRGLRCKTAHDCYEVMLQYAHDHPGEAVVAMAESAEADLERMLAEERRAIREEPRSRGSLAFPPKPRKHAKKMRRAFRGRVVSKITYVARRGKLVPVKREEIPMARRSRSRSLARRSVSVKPVVIRQTKVVKAKRRHHRGGGGGGLGLGGFLGGARTEMMMAGAALGFLDKSSFAASLPRLPFLGEHGTIAVAAYLFSQGGRMKLAANVCTLALGLSAYELVKTGAISGDDPYPM